MTITVGQLIAPARGGMIASACLTGLGALASLVPYVALTQIATIWLAGGSETEMWWWLIAAIIGTAAFILFYGTGLRVSHVVEARLRYKLRTQLVEKFGRLPLGRVAETPSGAIRKTVVDETTSIHTLVAHLSGDIANSVVALIGGLVLLFWADWLLTLALLGVWVGAMAIISLSTMRGYADSVRAYSSAQTELSAATVEMVEGIKEIKNFQATEVARTRHDRARRNLADLSYKWMNASGKSMAFLTALLKPGVVFATLTPLAVLFVSQGWTPVARTIPFFLISLGIPSGLSATLALMQHLYEAQMSAKSTAALLSKEDMPEGVETGQTTASIRFENVTFGYSPENPVVKNINFTVPAGTVTALVGPSGGGKTTIARLIARFYDVDQGSVQVCGRDVRELSQEWLLGQLAIVFQDVALTNDTVANNIRLGRPEATEDEIVAAAKAARIHERILRLPQGYDTVIGDEGGFLSGGEQQRVTIARAYLRDTPILILDEATASADPRSEHEIHQALTTLSAGRTVVIIAHRLATIAEADNIVVIADGEVVQQGKHDDLLAADGVYAELWALQNVQEK